MSKNINLYSILFLWKIYRCIESYLILVYFRIFDDNLPDLLASHKQDTR